MLEGKVTTFSFPVLKVKVLKSAPVGLYRWGAQPLSHDSWQLSFPRISLVRAGQLQCYHHRSRRICTPAVTRTSNSGKPAQRWQSEEKRRAPSARGKNCLLRAAGAPDPSRAAITGAGAATPSRGGDRRRGAGHAGTCSPRRAEACALLREPNSDSRWAPRAPQGPPRLCSAERRGATPPPPARVGPPPAPPALGAALRAGGERAACGRASGWPCWWSWPPWPACCSSCCAVSGRGARGGKSLPDLCWVGGPGRRDGGSKSSPSMQGKRHQAQLRCRPVRCESTRRLLLGGFIFLKTKGGDLKAQLASNAFEKSCAQNCIAKRCSNVKGLDSETAGEIQYWHLWSYTPENWEVCAYVNHVEKLKGFRLNCYYPEQRIKSRHSKKFSEIHLIHCRNDIGKSNVQTFNIK